jgi:dipeptidyl aminopeptidase/acylaminoacyl peptidase
MTTPPTKLLDSRPVELTTYGVNSVKRLYNIRVIEETVVERIVYLSDGLKVNGYLARPKEPGIYPVIIWNRGGNGSYGALDDLTSYLILASTAIWGYVLLATQYRGNMGSEGVEDWGGEDVNDAFNLIELAKQIPECDTNKIAVEGASRGGMTVYRLLTMYDQFKCAIVHAGVSDIPALIAASTKFRTHIEQLFGHLSENDRKAEIARRSGVLLASNFPKTTPILLLHGDADRTVPMGQSLAMKESLDQFGIPNELHILPGGGHVSLKDGSYKQIDECRKVWLEKYLK